MAEHEWERLYIVQDDPRGSGQLEPIYANMDRCEICKAIRIEDRLRDDQPYFYLRAGWSSHREPPCHE